MPRAATWARAANRVSLTSPIPAKLPSSLSDLHVDANTIMAALLHDVMEDCGVTFEDIESRFGTEVAGLVDSVTKLTKLDARFAQSAGAGSSPAEDQDRLDAESLRKMLVAMAEDVRVVLIKLADRLHNMNTLDALPPRSAGASLKKPWIYTHPWRTAWESGTSNGGWMTGLFGT